jgi:hypothetical protein
LLQLIVVLYECLANLKYHPKGFTLSTDKISYYEGEKITFLNSF